jgi:hypothetical protein
MQQRDHVLDVGSPDIGEFPILGESFICSGW